ncbi:MAG: RidA family protein [Acidobacteria bacterium]|nr:RidA family protein [Acidobacteriota bacterium]
MKKLPLLLLFLVLPALAEKKIIYPPEFRPNAPFSPGVLVNGTLYVAGQTGTDLKTNKLPENFQDEVRTCLDRIGIILKAAGMDFSDAVNVTVYITDIGLFPQMNEVYTTYFKANRPARATVQVAGLVGGAR